MFYGSSQISYLTSLTTRCARPLRHVIDIARHRLLVVSIMFVFSFLVLAVRLVDVTALRPDRESFLPDQVPELSLQMGRANILDRNGYIIATTLVTSSLYANAKQIQDYRQVAESLSKILPYLDKRDVVRRLKSKKTFVWLDRHLNPAQQAKVIRLGIPGLEFMRDERRVYPQGHLFSHVIGLTNIDNKGVAGFEKSMDSDLRRGRQSLWSSLDIRIQHILHNELTHAMKEYYPIAANGLIMDVQTGEILAMVSLPDFNPNTPTSKSDAFFNRNTLGIYEMGSTLKIVNTALVLETGVATLKSRYNAADPLSIGRFQVTDYHRHEGFLNVSEIFITSSNIGSAQMALSAGINRQKDFLKSIGLLDPQSLEVPEIGAPLAPKHWREANVMTISYGYGLSISPLQLATTVAGIVNGGIMPQPTLLKRDGNKTKCLRIVSQETSIQIRKLMRAAVINGTGRKANVPQYYVTGKTGTANVREGRHYKRGSVMTSFIGTLGASMDYPQYLVLIMLEEPQGKERSFGLNAAGWNAAPTAGRIFARMAPILGTTVFINDFDEEVVSPVSQVIHQATFEE